ncbi:MAG: F0F1 ATP synthase subunit B [Peptococcaceae bacterium]|nr:F0F1 ATP synthase subunit B [Peptococcaceae bacterium]
MEGGEQVLEFNATLLAQIVDFIILLIFLRVVAYKPLMKLLQERADHIAGTIAAAEQERQQAEQLRAGYEAEMRRAREQAQEIIQKATKAGEEQAHEIIENAKNEAARIKDAAMAEIQREKQKAMAELRDQVASLSILVAGKIINQKLTDEIQHSMVQDFIKEAGELPC